MKLIIVVDEENGIRFNKRRQSRDAELVKNIIALVGDANLYVSPYTRTLFPEDMPNIKTVENPIEEAGEGEYAMPEENCDWASIQLLEGVYVYKWSRVYPKDESFDMSLDDFQLEEEIEFEGKSHRRIGRQKYLC